MRALHLWSECLHCFTFLIELIIILYYYFLLKSFETALWYPEEIANAMWNLYSKVAEKFYGKPVDKVVRGLRGGKNF